MPRKFLAIAVSFAALMGASAVSAQEALNEDQCLQVIMAMSKLELSMVGKGPAEQARANLTSLQADLPEDVSVRIDELLEVSKSAQGIEPGDSQHPMATGEFQQASKAYREALGPYCPDFELDY